MMLVLAQLKVMVINRVSEQNHKSADSGHLEFRGWKAESQPLPSPLGNNLGAAWLCSWVVNKQRLESGTQLGYC